MISIIIGTNRAESKSRIVGNKIAEILASFDVKCQILDLKNLPASMLHPAMYKAAEQDPEISQLQDTFVSNVDKFIFVVPEYNGSFPGILKLFIDAVSVRNYKINFTDKKAFMIGVASGRLGNAVGLDHLASVFNYIGMTTFPQRLYLPAIDSKVQSNEFKNKEDQKVLEQMLREFSNY